MNTGTQALCAVAGVAALGITTGAEAADPPTRYRGDYTYGHEVNSFCPETGTACYWVGPETAEAVRTALTDLHARRTSRPYESVCVLVEGRIDRDATRTGFAADFDGLIVIDRLLGACDESAFVTPADLQHRRWVLDTVNGEPLAGIEPGGLVPELDFGENMHVAGNTGCNRYTGTGRLQQRRFSVVSMVSTARACEPAINALEATLAVMLSDGSDISIDEHRVLVLSTADAELRFLPSDWRR